MPNELSKDELILDILLNERVEQNALVSEQLIREIYDLQRRHQFDDDDTRDRVSLGIKRAVEAEVMQQGDET